MQEHTHKKLKHKVKNIFEKWVVYYSLIENKPFFKPEQFSWTQELEKNWEIICQELDKILSIQNVPTAQTILPTSGIKKLSAQWKIYALYGYGIKVEKNCQKCPKTTQLIEKIPGMKTAFFSILPPGTHLEEHRGPYNGVIRCLLGLKIPEQNFSHFRSTDIWMSGSNSHEI
ncbi:MAG: aspartyl/asparaginyl beta-hydroxylase domain-containing protein, partial [Leptolyngbya sp. SIO3F4]|nr:aspartyl/asparaginyl beta-hydroxylase domain-containing protein [Leptolyngbya sp. SIO3F4]